MNTIVSVLLGFLPNLEWCSTSTDYFINNSVRDAISSDAKKGSLIRQTQEPLSHTDTSLKVLRVLHSGSYNLKQTDIFFDGWVSPLNKMNLAIPIFSSITKPIRANLHESSLKVITGTTIPWQVVAKSHIRLYLQTSKRVYKCDYIGTWWRRTNLPSYLPKSYIH